MTKLYRGFNNNYPKTLGVKPEQKGIWMTDDIDFAKIYAEYFKNGAIAEIDLDDNANIANEYDCMNAFEDDEDWQDMADYICDLGGDIEFDNQVCDKLAESGYDGVMFDDNGVDCYYIFNRKIIKGSKVIKTFNNKSENAMECLNETKEEKFLAYHGSQHKNFNYNKDKILYLTTNKEKAISYAKREWDEGLIEGELPVVFTFEVNIKNPYECHTEQEFQTEFCEYHMNEEGGREELTNQGYDSIKYKDLIGLFSPTQFKLIDKEILPKSYEYYYPNEGGIDKEDIDDYYFDGDEVGFNDLDESIKPSLFNVLLESNILTEDIAAVKKYFPKVPEEKIQTLIELDPTYQGGDNLGKFGKWILGLYNKGNLKDEDFYKVPQYLTTFKDNLKKIQNKDIMSYKTLPDLAQAIQPYEGQKDESGRVQKARIKANEAEKVFNKNGWQIIVPKTYNASCYYGANTKWCTASRETSSYFENYTREGELYIIISPDGSKYQFHAQSWSFMDATDKPVAPADVISDEDVIAFIKEKIFDYIDYEMENNGNTELNFLDDLTKGMNGSAAIYANLGTLLSCVFDWYGGNENQTGTFSELLEEHLRNDISNKYCDILRTMKFPEGQNIFEMIEDSKYGTIYEFFDDNEAQNGLNNIYNTIINNIENFLINKTSDEFIKVKSIDIDDMDFFINVYDENGLDYPDDIKVDYFIKFGNISYGYSDGSLLDKMTTNMAGGRNFYADLVELFINDLSDMVKELCNKNKKPDMNEVLINFKNPFID